MVGIRYGNGFFILLEVAGFRGCTIIGGVRNCQCVGDVGAFAIENTQIKLVHSLNCIFAHSCFAVLHTKMEHLRLYPHVLEALAALRAKGFRLWLLSNAQRVFTAYELRYLGLGEQFDGIYLSSDYNCRKPDRKFFAALLDEQKLDPARCLMIGNDRETDIAGAVNAGLATLYLHTGLTPPDQEPADPARTPGKAPADCRRYEYEGDDWAALTALLCRL